MLANEKLATLTRPTINITLSNEVKTQTFDAKTPTTMQSLSCLKICEGRNAKEQEEVTLVLLLTPPCSFAFLPLGILK